MGALQKIMWFPARKMLALIAYVIYQTMRLFAWTYSERFLLFWLRLRQRYPRWLGTFSATARARLTNGMVMDCELTDLVQHNIYYHGVWEPLSTRLVRSLLKPGDGFVDVGAHVGYYTLLASGLVGPKGKVHAFEPSPETVRFLENNLRLNACGNVVVHEQAVSDRCCEVVFNTASPEHLGHSSMRELGTRAAMKTRVMAVSIDSMLDNIPPTKLVKIDVEGAEFLALCGMTQLIKRDAPYIILELTDPFLREMGCTAQQLVEFLRLHDYTVYLIGNGEPFGLRAMVVPPDSQCDILAIPSTKPFPEAGRADSGPSGACNE